MSCPACGQGIVRTIARGVVGLTQAALHLDPASPATAAGRLAHCRRCPHSTKHPTRTAPDGLPLVRFCGLCHCLLAAKTRLASARCPAGHW